jgi:putative peptidoglycan lipid II flippase
MIVDVIVSLALYKPLGIAGLIIGTVVANIVMTFLQVRRLRIGFNGRLELGQTTMITARILIATAISTVLGYFIWKGSDQLIGVSLIAQVVSMSLGLGAAGVAYGWLVLRMRVPEARQIEQLVLSRFPGRSSAAR